VLQMLEELLLALVVSGAICVPFFYVVGLHGSLLVFWMVYFLTLAGSKLPSALDELTAYSQPCACT
jgi:hypothetical protein